MSTNEVRNSFDPEKIANLMPMQGSINQKEFIVYDRDLGITSAIKFISYDGEIKIAVARSFLSKEDKNFSAKIGRSLALGRLRRYLKKPHEIVYRHHMKPSEAHSWPHGTTLYHIGLPESVLNRHEMATYEKAILPRITTHVQECNINHAPRYNSPHQVTV